MSYPALFILWLRSWLAMLGWQLV